MSHACRQYFRALVGLSLFAALVGCGRTDPLSDTFRTERVNPGGTGGGGTGGGGGGGIGGGGTGGTTPIMGCETDFDCTDSDSCTLDRCINFECVHESFDEDDDGFVSIACGGDDCNDRNANAHPGLLETCGDGDDNDCNGVADCLDPACANDANCGCRPDPNGENCTNGRDDDCDASADCLDSDCIGTAACGCATSELHCGNGFDDDCDNDIDCKDSDCRFQEFCQCRESTEFCGDNQDNDCDDLIDCADPDCAFEFECQCPPPGSPEQCGDLVDNDCDRLVDCADPECIADPACRQCEPEICTNGEDEDCDDLIDCADPDCAFHSACEPEVELCNNDRDDDHDGKIDCQDSDCANAPICIEKQSNCLSPRLITESGRYTGDTTGNLHEQRGTCGGDAGEAVFYIVLTEPTRVHLDTVGTNFDSVLYVKKGACLNGREMGCDDDSGGAWAAQLDFTILHPGTYYIFVDGFTVDPQGGANEGPFVLNVELEERPIERCEDALDNDGDRYVDCADPDCATHPRCMNCNPIGPGPEFGVGACTDGIDNDCDGATDCVDDDCSASDYYVTECCNGQDQNGNQIPDDFNCRCASDADCSGGICYTHTASTCGIPCTNFFGDVCPFVAQGSGCNASTQQCEF